MTTHQRPHVVVVGAGFAGLACVRALARSPVDITLIDRRNYHLFQPLLYQVATAALSPADIAWPIRSIVAAQPNVRVEMARVSGVDADRQTVVTEDGRWIAYDQLVLATGARHSYFGRDDWEEVAPGLKKIADATAIRERVLLAFERAETEPDPFEQSRLLTFVVIGAGPTGVEMAGALAELARHALSKDFRSIDPRRTRVVLIEAGARVLPSFPSGLSLKASRALERLGVEVRLGQPVTRCDADGVTVGDDRIPARSIVWAAGVVASPAARWLDAMHDRAGRVTVTDSLNAPGRPEVFVIGDTALANRPGGRPVPGIAPAAKQMGSYVGQVIDRRVRGLIPLPAFRYRHQGDMATIGRKAAVAVLGGVQLSGPIAWLMWALVHVYFLIGWRSRLLVSLNWLWSYLTFDRGARLITMEPAAASIPRPEVRSDAA
jgi:NADH:ubiquinone reductase (H+-translocating)